MCVCLCVPDAAPLTAAEEEELERLREYCEEQEVKHGTTIFFPDEPADWCVCLSVDHANQSHTG